MTVPATTRKAGPYTGNSSATSFAFSFKTDAATDIKVSLITASVETVLSPSAYTVTLNGDQDASPGGSVTYPTSGSPITSATQLLIASNLPISQTTDLPEGGRFNAATVEGAIDRTVMMVGQLDEKLGRALTVSAFATSASPALPIPEGNTLLGWNGAGTAIINYTASGAPFSADSITFDPGLTGSNPNTVQEILRRNKHVGSFGAEGGAGDQSAAFIAALNSGASIIETDDINYNLASTVSVPDGRTLKCKGKSRTSFTLLGNITAFAINNANDATLSGALIIAHATQTNAMIALNATMQTITRCKILDMQCSGLATDFPFISINNTGGPYGNWAHEIHDVSASGCGTILRCETFAFQSWINSINMSHVYANDFIRGVHIVPNIGEGCADSTFFDWSAQTSARTQFGANIEDVSTQGYSRKNTFNDVKWYDLINGGGQAYIIGVNVLDTAIKGHIVDDPSPLRIIDRGIGTQLNGQIPFDYFTRKARREITVSTSTGLTQDVSGTGTTASIAPYVQLRTGATGGSLARRYSTDAVSGLSQNQIFNTNFSLPFRFTFTLARITAGGSAVGRVQFKRTQSDGSLAAPGVGIQINNYAVFGESYGSGLATVNLGLTMVDAEAYRIDIYVYPALRVEWWVNGVLAGVQTTVANVPSGLGACYFHSSLANVAANDVQMFITPPELAAGI